METLDSHGTTATSCARCGNCCLSVFLSFTDEDVEIWRREGKEGIADAVEHVKIIWAGDIMLFAEDGMILYMCPFLRREGTHCTCVIYEHRPRVCREYAPGSSELCSQYKKIRSTE
jgi:Fe-S-cluster containining protein